MLVLKIAYGFKKLLILNFQELDAFLLDKVFFVGSAVTLADLLIFHGLHHIMVWFCHVFKFCQTQELYRVSIKNSSCLIFINVFCTSLPDWFDILSEAKVQQSLSVV